MKAISRSSGVGAGVPTDTWLLTAVCIWNHHVMGVASCDEGDAMFVWPFDRLNCGEVNSLPVGKPFLAV